MTRQAIPTAIRGAVLAVLLGAALAGCGSLGVTPSPGPVPTAAATLPGCGPIEHPPLQVSQHLVGDADPPSNYSSVPPSSGWHTTSPPDAGQVVDRLDDPDIVAVLEAGTVVLAVDPILTGDDEVMATVVALVDQFPDRLLATPYPDMATPVALLTWGRIVRCDTVDPAAVTAFVLTQRLGAPH